ncbi:MAG: hypothetical protein KatS3mg087_1276 [Patescibacteria group bacterium]|nr:MAG: hypothetical protein KatS3mg087_1276 [Patescibacteria group bacterium]
MLKQAWKPNSKKGSGELRLDNLKPQYFSSGSFGLMNALISHLEDSGITRDELKQEIAQYHRQKNNPAQIEIFLAKKALFDTHKELKKL